MIAQEVEEAFPELIRTDEHGMKSVDYNGLVAPLIEAVKELDAQSTKLAELVREHQALKEEHKAMQEKYVELERLVRGMIVQNQKATSEYWARK